MKQRPFTCALFVAVTLAGCSSSTENAGTASNTGGKDGGPNSTTGGSHAGGSSSPGGANTSGASASSGGSGASASGSGGAAGSGGGGASTGGGSASAGRGGTNAGGATNGGATSNGGAAAASDSGADASSPDAAPSNLCGSAPCTATRCAGIGCGPAVCCGGPNGPVCIHGATECPAADGGVRTETLRCLGVARNADFARSCSKDSECFVAEHWAGCCHIDAVGLNVTEKTAFSSFETSCGGPPACGCCCDRVFTESGMTVASGTAVSVRCVAGMCTTSSP